MVKPGERCDNLEHFYVEGNKLFDKKFLKWYIQKFYGIELNEHYILHIIDTEINMFDLKNNGYIKLKKKHEKDKQYIVIEDDK